MNYNTIRIGYDKWHIMSQEDLLVYLQERGFDVEEDYKSHLDEEAHEMVYRQESQFG